MNPKMNTLVFVIVGTIIHVLMALVFIFILLVVAIKITAVSGNPQKLLMSYSIFAIIAGMILAMIVYQKLTKWVIGKFDLEEKLDPLFTARHRKKK